MVPSNEPSSAVVNVTATERMDVTRCDVNRRSIKVVMRSVVTTSESPIKMRVEDAPTGQQRYHKQKSNPAK